MYMSLVSPADKGITISSVNGVGSIVVVNNYVVQAILSIALR